MGDNQDNSGKGDDLLSQLMSLEDEKPAPATPPKRSEKSDLFSGPTRLGDADDTGSQGRRGILENVSDKTEVLPADKDSKPSLESFLTPSITGAEPPAKPTSTPMEFGDNLFDGILDDEPLPDEKINFFTSSLKEKKAEANAPAPPEEQTVLDAGPAPEVEQNPFAPESKMDKTIVLSDEAPADSSPTEFVATPSEISSPPSAGKNVDPIDQALESFVEGQTDFKLDSAVAPKSEDSALDAQLFSEEPAETAVGFSQPSKEVVSSKELNDLFGSGPIQIPEAPLPVRRKGVSFKKVLRTVGVSLGLGAVAFVGYATFKRLQTDQGLFGYRLEGWNFVRAYRPPDEAQLAEFSKIFQASQNARTSDDPLEIESVEAKLVGILQEDVRNFEAASLVLEHRGLLILWKGVSSPWVQKFNETEAQLNFIATKTGSMPSLPAMNRAYAWRALAIEDIEGGYSDLEKRVEGSAHLDDATIGLLTELAFRKGDMPAVEKWFGRLKDKSFRRVQFVDALLDVSKTGSNAKLSKMAKGGYWPARVEIAKREKIDPTRARDQLEKIDQLIEDVKEYPNLAFQLRSQRAAILLATGDSEGARKEWKMILERYPKNTALWARLARSFEDDAMWDDAMEAYQSAEAQGDLGIDVSIQYASLLRARGRVLDAVTLLEKKIEKYPKSAPLHFERGRVKLSLYQEEAAKEAFTTALKHDPKFEMATIALAELALSRKLYAEAENLLTQIPESSKWYPEALRSLGHLWLRRNNPEKAKSYFLRAVDANPRLEQVYADLLRLYLREENDRAAEALYAKGLEVLPRSATLKIGLTKIYKMQGKSAQRKEILENLVRTHEHLTSVQLAYVDFLISEQKFKEASEILGRLRALEIKDPELNYEQAKLYLADETGKVAGSVEGASRLVEAVVKENPSDERYRLLAARIAARLQDRSTALEHIGEILRVYPNYAPALVVQGDLYRDWGDYPKALHSYQDAARHTRFQTEVNGRLAEVYRSLGNLQGAIKYYQRVVSADPNNVRALLELGKMYNQDGRYASALGVLQKASAIDPNFPEPYFLMGFIQKEMGATQAAIRSFEKFLEMSPNGSEAATIRDEIFFLKRSSQN